MKQVVKPGQIPDTWLAEALYTKAVRYAEKMASAGTDTWDHALWSGLCLELLARAALANLAPALLADPSKPSNLLHALGFPPLEPKYAPRSIDMAQVLARLKHLLEEFDTELESFCAFHVGRRNSELHSGDLPFDVIHGSSWHGQYYRACSVLLSSMGYGLADFIGEEGAKIAVKEMEAAADQAAKAVEGDVKAFAKVWSGKDDVERAALVAQATAWATRGLGHRVTCPACGSDAVVIGEPIGAPQMSLKDDVITEKQEHLPHWFQCIACGLKIVGLSRLQVIGLGDRYTSTKTYEAAEYYAEENDHYADYEDDNNEPV